jgi:hypothetical protein
VENCAHKKHQHDRGPPVHGGNSGCHNFDRAIFSCMHFVLLQAQANTTHHHPGTCVGLARTVYIHRLFTHLLCPLCECLPLAGITSNPAPTPTLQHCYAPFIFQNAYILKQRLMGAIKNCTFSLSKWVQNRHRAPDSTPKCQISGKCQWHWSKNRYVAFKWGTREYMLGELLMGTVCEDFGDPQCPNSWGKKQLFPVTPSVLPCSHPYLGIPRFMVGKYTCRSSHLCTGMFHSFQYSPTVEAFHQSCISCKGT